MFCHVSWMRKVSKVKKHMRISHFKGLQKRKRQKKQKKAFFLIFFFRLYSRLGGFHESRQQYACGKLCSKNTRFQVLTYVEISNITWLCYLSVNIVLRPKWQKDNFTHEKNFINATFTHNALMLCDMVLPVHTHQSIYIL